MTALLNTFTAGDRIRAWKGQTVIVGEVVHYNHMFDPHVEIRPDGVGKFTTFPIWASDGWQIEHLAGIEPS